MIEDSATYKAGFRAGVRHARNGKRNRKSVVIDMKKFDFIKFFNAIEDQRTRDVLWMRIIKNMTLREIAKEMNCCHQNVQLMLEKAMAQAYSGDIEFINGKS